MTDPLSRREERWEFKRVNSDKMVRALELARNLSGFEAAGEGSCVLGRLHGLSALPPRHALLASRLLTFHAIATECGATDAALPSLVRLSNWVDCHWYEVRGGGRFLLDARLFGEHWSFQLIDFEPSGDERWAFFEDVVEKATLPVRWSERASNSVVHTGGLAATLSSMYGLSFELERNDASELLRYFREVGEAMGAPIDTTDCAMGPRAGVASDEAYDALFAAQLAAKQFTLSYELPPAAPRLAAGLHGLCRRADDRFLAQVGWFTPLPEQRGALELETTKKGHELTLVFYDLEAFLEDSVAKDILADLSRVLGLRPAHETLWASIARALSGARGSASE